MRRTRKAAQKAVPGLSEWVRTYYRDAAANHRRWLESVAGDIAPLILEWEKLTLSIDQTIQNERQFHRRLWEKKGDFSKPVPQFVRTKVGNKLFDLRCKRVVIADKIARAKYCKGMDRSVLAYLKMKIAINTDPQFNNLNCTYRKWGEFQIPAVKSALSLLIAAKAAARKGSKLQKASKRR